MKLPTASALQRVMTCPPSHVLPQVYSLAGEAADIGTSIHSYIELRLKKGLSEKQALAALPAEHHERCRNVDLASLKFPAEHLVAREIAFGFNYKTGNAKVLGHSLGRNYPQVPETAFVGTMDVVARTPDIILVEDYKTGRGHVPPPADNWQLRFGALAAARAFGGPQRVRANIVHIREDGWVEREVEAEWDAEQLNHFAAELANLGRQLQAGLYTSASPVTVGPHCSFCPAIASCPANIASVRTLALLDTDAQAAIIESLTPEQAAQLWPKAKQALGALYFLQDALVRYAENAERAGTPLEVRPGVFLRSVDASRETVQDHDAALRILADAYGNDFAQACAEQRTSKTAIKAAAKRARLDADEAYDKLREVGALASSGKTKIEEVGG